MTGIVVEFCGLPGTGKSTLAGLVSEALMDRDVYCTIADAPISAAVSRSGRIAVKAARAITETSRHPVRTAHMAGWIASSGQESTRDTVATLAQWLAVQRTVTNARRGPGVHLLEEGVVQTLWTLG
ncbi:MAG: hypothetical protein GEU93_18610, partial [Propionibacteriales bacterium]|nr:hypothetical protein [Propionibacteriales bacterium]